MLALIMVDNGNEYCSIQKKHVAKSLIIQVFANPCSIFYLTITSVLAVILLLKCAYIFWCQPTPLVYKGKWVIWKSSLGQYMMLLEKLVYSYWHLVCIYDTLTKSSKWMPGLWTCHSKLDLELNGRLKMAVPQYVEGLAENSQTAEMDVCIISFVE